MTFNSPPSRQRKSPWIEALLVRRLALSILTSTEKETQASHWEKIKVEFIAQ